MLYLRTGLPGAGKTLNAIREIDIEHQPDPDDPTKRLHKDPDNPDLPPRTIYFYGIPDMKLDRLKSKWVEFDTPEEWYNLPDGSVIVIDEAQRVFGNDGTRARPEKVTRFETHRHQGLDIHLITQHPSLLCTPVRKLVGKHINFIRPYGREKGIFRHEYEFCIDNPERRSNFKQAQEERVTLDKAYFGVYKSSTVHTHKPITPSYMKKIPLIIVLMLIPIGVLVGLVVTAMRQGDEEKEAALARSQAAEVSAGVLPGAGNAVQAAPRASSGSKSTDEFIGDMSPRVPDLVASAPRYDDLNKPRDFPRPVCAASSDPNLIGKAPERRIPMGTYNGRVMVCQCYTQQVTRMHTTFEFCMDVVNNGYFDDTRMPPTYASGNSTRGLITSPSVDPATAIERGRAATSPTPGDAFSTRVTIVPDSSRTPRTL
ncbi:zonular occludens toxin [Pseudomonas aeruginosa]|uniref:zonular occludens toxin domain-containing protein n=1 Tax=Pseudomonas aeruginosa TaxID=287 RepID=UPI00066D51A3|nr:zonular occludens toxin domain-containing protein [Pseudomonas aeruginosa]MBG5712176.1 zonular occludens toxin [Pseudomonas aeruginosa]MDG9806957.1 zonular occludens toxin [Pseudomonas aeruginosa]MDG9907695.1 zonular occludens toxin [Pseudomonas aeruginosa]MDH0005584.1 zonular occludens toxin [Pseudomonas aeruginosa]MDH0012225.1 zonular occludens toxin [Pseudomonas aeruginosa]